MIQVHVKFQMGSVLVLTLWFSLSLQSSMLDVATAFNSVRLLSIL